jgi:hypothetical protein
LSRVEAPSGRGFVDGGPTRARSRGLRDELGGPRATSGRGCGRPSKIGVVGVVGHDFKARMLVKSDDS